MLPMASRPPPRPEPTVEPDILAKLVAFSGLPSDTFTGQVKTVRNKYFEDFVAYHVLKCWHVADFEKSDIAAAMTGASEDNQLDTLCVLINGVVVRDAVEAQTLIDEIDEPTIAYVFIQTTTTERFERAKMNQVVTGIQNFFAPRPYFPENDALKARRAIKDKIAELLGERAQSRIQSYLYYVAPGRWNEERDRGGDAEPLGWRAYAEEKVREATSAASTPGVQVIDLGRLRDMIKRNEIGEAAVPQSQPVAKTVGYSRTITASDLIELPELGGVAKGYMGYLHSGQFVRLLEREDGQGLLDQLAYSNVRVFQGANNEVNAEIADTIASNSRGQFLLLNNGVTLIASKAEWLRDKRQLRLDNYQIANGLQTSNMLYQQRRHLDPSSPVYVPVKIVVTTDPALMDAVVRSSNRQTAIGNLQHAGHAQFVRNLWHAFNERRERATGEPLWLERRDGEWADNGAITDDNRVLTLPDMLAAITATFLRQPHVAGAGEAALRMKIPSQIFNDAHRKQQYLTVARMLYVVRNWLAKNGDDDLSRFEFQLAYGLLVLIEPTRTRPDLTAVSGDKICEAIERRLDQKAVVDQALGLAAQAIREITRPLKSTARIWRDLRTDKGRLTTPLDKRLTALRGKLKWG